MSQERWEVRLGGFGGQGVVTAGYLLGQAALLEGRHAVLTKFFGPQIRGGRVRADLILSRSAVDYPQVRRPDVLVCFSQDAYDRWRPALRAGGTVLVDEDLVRAPDPQGVQLMAVPAQRQAEELGKRVVANNVLLGALVAATGLVGFEALDQALARAVPPPVLELNRRALQAGRAHGSKLPRPPQGDPRG